jgi:hypothetical protein
MRSAGCSKTKANVSDREGFEASSLAVRPLKCPLITREMGANGEFSMVLWE